MITGSIVFISGEFVSNTCWDDWRIYFESEGYSTCAPPWPYKKGTAADLRARHPDDTDLASLTFAQLTDYYISIVKNYAEKPIVIGHSLGGLIAQIICNRNLAAAAVAIHSVPPYGFFPCEISFLRTGWSMLGLFNSIKKTYLMPFRMWQYAFVNGMPFIGQKATYEKYVIPESRTVLGGALAKAARVDFLKPHPPLLLTGGTEGIYIPARLSRHIFKKYRRNNSSVVGYREFKECNHCVFAGDSWIEEANYVLEWLKNISQSG